MTKNRWLAVAGMMACLICAGLVLPVLLPPLPGLTEANFARIEEGMTREEVGAILGGEPSRVSEFDHPEDGTIECWQNDNNQDLAIVFRHGKVWKKHWLEERSETTLQKIGRWLRLEESNPAGSKRIL